MRSLPVMAVGQMAANAVLLGIGYYWLGVPESRGATLVWSIVVALLFVVLACWSYGAVLAYFAEDGRGGQVWKHSALHLLPLVLGAVGMVLLLWAVKVGADHAIASAAKMHGRVRPATAASTIRWAARVLEFGVLPVMLLPMLSAIARQGWRGFGAIGSMSTKWLFWIEVPVLIVLAFRVPLWLVLWVPRIEGFRAQAVSFGVRAIAAYFLLAAGWLLLAFVTSRGKPVPTHAKTVVAP